MYTLLIYILAFFSSINSITEIINFFFNFFLQFNINQANPGQVEMVSKTCKSEYNE